MPTTTITTLGPLEAAAIVAPWRGLFEPGEWLQRVAQARDVLHRHIVATEGRELITYREFQERLDWYGRGRAMGNLLDGICAWDEADGLPLSTSIIVAAGGERPADGSGQHPAVWAYHQRMVCRCWMAFKVAP